MCGFTGFFNLDNLNNKSNIDIMFSHITRRGPDENRMSVINKKLVLLFSRLSILDLSSNGSQPMTSNSGNLTIVFNGEIYNLKFIKELLKSNGYNLFKSSSDTEILLQAFEFFGLSILDKIKGMFSIALYNRVNSSLTLINDRFGEKPLFYSYSKDNIFFSSDIKSFDFKKRSIRQSSIVKLFEYNTIPYPYTIWDDVNKINPAEILEFKLDFENNIVNLISKKKYWDYSKPVKIRDDSLEQFTDKLELKLFEVIDCQLKTDVDNGCFLSGGIDSSLVSCIASKVSEKKLTTISVGFSNSKFDESIYATDIANYLNTNHYNKILDLDNISNIINLLPDIYGEPFSDSSQIPTTLLCQFASSKVKVVLTGDGADELFGGYDRYLFVPKFWKIIKYLPFPIRQLIKKFYNLLKPYSYKISTYIIQKLLKKYPNTIYFESKLYNLVNALDSKNSIEFSKKLSIHFYNDFGIVLSNDFSDHNFIYNKNDTVLRNILSNDVSDYLPNDLLVKTDRASMYYGLEARMPFLDHEIYEFSKMLPDKYKVNSNMQKVILKNLLKRHLPKRLYERPKHGFLAPLSEIIYKEIKLIKNILDNDKIKKQGYLDHDMVKKELNSFVNGDTFNQYNLWDIVIFQQWLDNNEKNIL